MKRFRAVPVTIGISLLASHAMAQSTLEPTAHSAPPRPALWGGVFALGAGYAVAGGLAYKHRDESATHWLWLPVAGPFVALGARSEADNGCVGGGADGGYGTRDEYCKDRSLDWALVFDGAIQTLGAGLIVSSFVFEGNSQVGVGFNRNGPVAAGRF
ncbi:MAG: hypothetical protein AB7K71_33075 [Polyangiaceae bacterium]